VLPDPDRQVTCGRSGTVGGGGAGTDGTAGAPHGPARLPQQLVDQRDLGVAAIHSVLIVVELQHKVTRLSAHIRDLGTRKAFPQP
jgi:hypothetical protein